MRQARKKDQKRFSLTAHMKLRLREGLSLMSGAVAAYLLLSLATYTSTDPGWTNLTTNHHIANWGGRVGAWVADILFLLMGYVAYIFPLMLLFWVFKSFSAQK